VDARTYYWNLILVHPLERGLTYLSQDLGLGAGLAIILFTIIIRMVLLPLTLQQIRSQKAMQRLQPEIKALQKKYAGDREKISAETMALYKEHGYNPATGCLPLVLQMPVLFALYAALRDLGEHNETFQAPWLWLSNLNHPDVIVIGTVSLPFILPILAGITQWVQQRMMTPPTDDPQQKMQNSMMQFMPLMMLWFGLSFSSGLALYWVTQNLFGIVQQYFVTGFGSLPLPPGFAPRGAGGVQLIGGGSPVGQGQAPVPPRDSRDSRDTARSGHRDGGRARGANRGTSGGSGGVGSGDKREGRRTSGKR
jgi:YidC/Oxa1 family membrane protein insertase